MKVHRLAEMIPSMTEESFKEFKNDIRNNGQREPITLFENQILDGRHRYRACKELGLDVDCKHYEGTEPAAFVISLNVNRRSLTTGQKAAIAVEFLPELEKEAASRKVSLGRDAAIRQHHGSGSVDPHPPTNPHRAREDAGVLVGVSGATVDRVRRVKDEDPQAFEEIKSGAKSPRAASDKLQRQKAPAKTPQTFSNDTERGRNINRAASERLWKLVSGLDGYRMGLQDFNVDRAIAGATDEEVKQWDRTITDSIKSFRDLRARLREER
jgi:hypothetical protein